MSSSITKFIFGKNYKFFEVSSDNGKKTYYVANGSDTIGNSRDIYHEIDVYSQGLSSIVHKLVDIDAIPMRYGSNLRDCDIYLPNLDTSYLSSAKSLYGQMYMLSPKTSADFVHPTDVRDFVSLSGVCDSTNSYSLSSTGQINSYLFNQVEDVIQNSDALTSYNDFKEFVRLNTQMNRIYQFFCKKYSDVVNYMSKNQSFEDQLSSIVFSDYLAYLEDIEEIQESEDVRFAKLVINSFLVAIAGNDFNSSMSWEEHSAALKSIFEKIIGQYINSETIPTLIDGIDDILHETYEAVLSTEVEDESSIDYTGTEGNTYGDNYDIGYSYKSVIDNANKTYVTDQLSMNNNKDTYADVIKGELSSCFEELERINSECVNLCSDFLNAIHNRTVQTVFNSFSTDGCKNAFNENVLQNLDGSTGFQRVLIMYAQYRTSSGCPYCWSSKTTNLGQQIDKLMADALTIYDSYVNIYNNTKNYLTSPVSLSSINKSNLYSTTDVFGDNYIVASKRLPFVTYNQYTGKWQTTNYYGKKFDLSTCLMALSNAIDYSKVKYTQQRLGETSEKKVIKKGTLAVVDEVVKGHEQWEDSLSVHEFLNTYDISVIVNISDDFEYYCSNSERLCAWVSICSDVKQDIQKEYCDSTIKIDAYEISAPLSVTQYYFCGILQSDIDNDNLMTPIKKSYANIFNKISAYSYNTKETLTTYNNSGQNTKSSTKTLLLTIQSYTDETVNDFQVFKGATTKAVDMYKDGGNYTCQVCCIYPPGSKYNEWYELKPTTLSSNKLAGYMNFYNYLGEEQYIQISSTDPEFKSIINELTSSSQDVKDNINTITLYDLISSYAVDQGKDIINYIDKPEEDNDFLSTTTIAMILTYTNDISTIIGEKLTTLLKSQFKNYDLIESQLPTFMTYVKSDSDIDHGKLWSVIRNTDWVKENSKYTNVLKQTNIKNIQRYSEIQDFADCCLCDIVDSKTRGFIDMADFYTYTYGSSSKPTVQDEIRKTVSNMKLIDVFPQDGVDLSIYGDLKIEVAGNGNPIIDVTPEYIPQWNNYITPKYENGDELTVGYLTSSNDYEITVGYDGIGIVSAYCKGLHGNTDKTIKLYDKNNETDIVSVLNGNGIVYYMSPRPIYTRLYQDKLIQCTSSKDIPQQKYFNYQSGEDESKRRFATKYTDDMFDCDFENDYLVLSEVLSSYKKEINGISYLAYKKSDNTEQITELYYNDIKYYTNEDGSYSFSTYTDFGRSIINTPYSYILNNTNGTSPTYNTTLCSAIDTDYYDHAKLTSFTTNYTTAKNNYMYYALSINPSIHYKEQSYSLVNISFQVGNESKSGKHYPMASYNLGGDVFANDLCVNLLSDLLMDSFFIAIGTRKSKHGATIGDWVGSFDISYVKQTTNITSTTAFNQNPKNLVSAFLYEDNKFVPKQIITHTTSDPGYYICFKGWIPNSNSVTYGEYYYAKNQLTGIYEWQHTRYVTNDSGGIVRPNITYLNYNSLSVIDTDIRSYGPVIEDSSQDDAYDIYGIRRYYCYKEYKTISLLSNVGTSDITYLNSNGQYESNGSAMDIVGWDRNSSTGKITYYTKYTWTPNYNSEDTITLGENVIFIKNGTRRDTHGVLNDLYQYTSNGTTVYSCNSNGCYLKTFEKDKSGNITAIYYSQNENPKVYGVKIRGIKIDTEVEDGKYPWIRQNIITGIWYGEDGVSKIEYTNKNINSDSNYIVYTSTNPFNGTDEAYLKITKYDTNGVEIGIGKSGKGDNTTTNGIHVDIFGCNSSFVPTTGELTSVSQESSFKTQESLSDTSGISYKYYSLPTDSNSGISYIKVNWWGATEHGYEPRYMDRAFMEISKSNLEFKLVYAKEGTPTSVDKTYGTIDGPIVQSSGEQISYNNNYNYLTPLTGKLTNYIYEQTFLSGEEIFSKDNNESGGVYQHVYANRVQSYTHKPIFSKYYSAQKIYNNNPNNFDDYVNKKTSIFYATEYTKSDGNKYIRYYNGGYPELNGINVINDNIIQAHLYYPIKQNITDYCTNLRTGKNKLFAANNYKFTTFGKQYDKTTVENLTPWCAVQEKLLIKYLNDPEYTLKQPLYTVLSNYITRISNLDNLFYESNIASINQIVADSYLGKKEGKSIKSTGMQSFPFRWMIQKYKSILVPNINVTTATIDVSRSYQPIIYVYAKNGSIGGWLKFQENLETNADNSDSSLADEDLTLKTINSIREILQTGKVWIDSNQSFGETIDNPITDGRITKQKRVPVSIIVISVKNNICLEKLRKGATLEYKTVQFDYNDANPNSWINISSYTYPTGSAILDPNLYTTEPKLDDGTYGNNDIEIVKLVKNLSGDVIVGRRNIVNGCYEEINSDPHPTISWYDSNGKEQSLNAELSVVGKYNSKSPAKSTYYIWYNAASNNYRLNDYASNMSQVLSANSNSILNIYQNYPYLYNIVVESAAKYFSQEFVKDKIFEHFAGVYHDMLEEIDYDVDTSYTSYYDAEGNEIKRDKDGMYENNSKISYLYDNLTSTYQQYLIDSSNVKQNLNALQTAVLNSYYSRLPHKYLSSETIMNYAVKSQIDQNVIDSTVSNYIRTGFLKYENYNKLQKTAIDVIDQYHQNFKSDLDLDTQLTTLNQMVVDYSSFKFSDSEIKNLRQPISVYNVNDEGYYMSSIVKGYDISPNNVSSLCCDDSGFILYYLSGAVSPVKSTYKVLGTNMEFDHKANQIYTVSSYVAHSYKNLSTYSEILLDNYSEISDKVYFDLKDEIVDNITEVALKSVLATWDYLTTTYGDNFEFKYYYDNYLTSNTGSLDTTVISEDPVDMSETATYRKSLSYSKDSGFWNITLDYNSDLRWDKVGNKNFSKHKFSDEWKIWDHACDNTAKESVAQAIQGFRYAKLLLYFKYNIHEYVQNIMDQGYLRDSLNIINNALIVEIGKLLTSRIASNETHQKTIFKSTVTDVINYIFTKGRNYNESGIKAQFKQQFKKDLFELNNLNLDAIKTALSEKTKENASKVNSKFYNDVSKSIQDSFSKLISEAYNNIPYKLDISSLIQDGNLRENLAQYTTYLLNTDEYYDEILSGCNNVESQNSALYDVLSTNINSMVDSKIGRQISTDYYSTTIITTNPHYNYGLNFANNINNSYSENVIEYANQVTSQCEGTFVSLNKLLSTQYNNVLHNVVDQHLDLLSAHHIISEVVKINSILSNLTYNYMIEVPLNRQSMQLRDGCLDVNAAITKVPYNWNYSIDMSSDSDFVNLRQYDSINVCGNTVYLKYQPCKKCHALCFDLTSSDIKVYDMSNLTYICDLSSMADHIEVLKSIDAEVESYAKHRTNVYSIDITNSGISDETKKQNIKNKINMIVEQLMPMNTQIYDIRFDN